MYNTSGYVGYGITLGWLNIILFGNKSLEAHDRVSTVNTMTLLHHEAQYNKVLTRQGSSRYEVTVMVVTVYLKVGGWGVR